MKRYRGYSNEWRAVATSFNETKHEQTPAIYLEGLKKYVHRCLGNVSYD